MNKQELADYLEAIKLEFNSITPKTPISEQKIICSVYTSCTYINSFIVIFN